ncbi:hypothetical protein ABB55_14305 [Prosthecomicrobium hirschii]|uniref:Uncharacterized protein n=2 Tax=Prosthecodimorpha hirschii TaxID=665126 RepID=A0A0P6VPU6_9HYPH|nr:hypothetical protein ABB55_14305 [Prosthecomicrobium hirschii]
MLVSGLWVKLLDPIEIPNSLRSELNAMSGDATPGAWLSLARAVRRGEVSDRKMPDQFELGTQSAPSTAMLN